MDIKTFTKQNLAVLSYQSVLYENIQAYSDNIPLTKMLLVCDSLSKAFSAHMPAIKFTERHFLV
jgi:hypothetical protein